MHRQRISIESMLILLLVCTAAARSGSSANQTGDANGTEAAVRTKYYRQKSTHYRFDHLRSGAIRTARGWWNVQDFAHSLFNPNSEEITVNLKMVSDDPKFVFANGQVGTYTKTYHLKPLFGVTDNVYLCPEFESQKQKPDWPVSSRSNFTGSVELSSSEPFYYFMLHETPEGKSPDLVKAYFMAWDPCEYDEPAVWDNDLNQFVIPYTNYWHDEKYWRVGWHSELIISNNTDQPETYTLKHIPYYGGQYDPRTQRIIKYKEQVVRLTVQPHGTKQSTLMELFGWGDKMSSMEGCLLITPSQAGAHSGTTAGLLIVPNDSGEPFHEAIQ